MVPPLAPVSVRHRLAISLIVLVLLVLTGAAPARAVPQGDALQRLVPPLPTPASFIADVPTILSAEAHAEADTRIRALQEAGLGDLAVAILPAIGDHAPDQVGVAIYRTWKVGSMAAIGSAHRNVGVLLLIVPKELAPDGKGQCWITTGTGAEGIVTDAASGTICRDAIIPLLKEKDYDGAVLAGIDALGARLRGDEGLTAPGSTEEIQAPGSSGGGHFPWWQTLLGFTVIPVVMAYRRWRRYRPRRCPKCGQRMTRLDEQGDDAQLAPGQQVEERIASIDYDVWACTCGEHLVIPYRKIFTRYTACRECHNRAASSTRRIIMPASTLSSGTAEDRWSCKACPATWTTQVILPRIVESSGSSGSSGGGGGGSSFGGSGSTGGGGGGSSY